MSKLEKVYKNIDQHIEKHILKLQEFVRQPSVSQTGEGVRECAELLKSHFEEFGVKYAIYPPVASMLKFYPAWPAYVFAGEPLRLPIVGAALGHGGRAHSPNEYFVIEGADARHGRIHGLAGAEKSMATILYNYAGKE